MSVDLGAVYDDLRQDRLAEEAYDDMLAHPETVVDAPDLFGKPSWSMQAAADREKAQLIVMEARCRIRGLQDLLDGYDKQLSYKLMAYMAELDARLGALMVADLDAAR